MTKNIGILERKFYLTPGYYNKRRVPDVYIGPKHSSYGGREEEIIYHSKGIYVTGFPAETRNLSEEFSYSSTSGYAHEFMKAEKYEKSLIDTFKVVINFH